MRTQNDQNQTPNIHDGTEQNIIKSKKTLEDTKARINQVLAHQGTSTVVTMNISQARKTEALTKTGEAVAQATQKVEQVEQKFNTQQRVPTSHK